MQLNSDSLPGNSQSEDTFPESEWSGRRIILGTLTVFGIVVIFLLLYRFYMVVFLAFVGISLQIAIDPLVERLHRYGVPRFVGVALVYVLLLILFGLFLWLVAPPLISQARTVIEQLPDYFYDARMYLLSSPFGVIRGIGYVLPPQLTMPVLLQISGSEATSESAGFQEWQWIELSSRVLFAIVAVFAVAYYWAVEGDLLLRRLVLFAPAQRRAKMRELIEEFEAKIGAFARGQTILCVIIGVLSTAAFVLLGIPNALLLGLLMGIFEAIPVLGPILGAIPALVTTLSTAPQMTLWVALVLIVIQVAENNLLVPRIMSEAVGVNAIVTLLAITAFGALFGITGAILAIPLAAILQLIFDRILFDPASEAETGATSAPVSRSQMGALRLEAREIASSIRKQARNAGAAEDSDPHLEQAEDAIEALAVDLDGILAQLEQHT